MSTFDDTDQFMVLDTKPSDSQFLTEISSGLDRLCRCCKSLSSLMQRPPTYWLDCSRCGRWWWWGGGKGGRGDLQVEDLMVPWHCNWFSLMTMAIMMIVWLVCLFRWNGCNVWTGEIVISGAKFHIVQLEVWLNKEHFPLKKSNLLCNLLCLFSGHHADEMSEGSQVSKVDLCVKILKWHPVTHWPTDQGQV